MKKIKQFYRLLYINYILAKYGLDEIILSNRLFSPFRFVKYFNPWRWFNRERLPRGVAIRLTLETLGPIFVKFGQALSTRPDLVPSDIALELTKLQDSVPPFASKTVLHILEASFGRSAKDLFSSFDEMPLASASVAQVHAATLKCGASVVVKILRPGIRAIIEQDLGILKVIAALTERYWAVSRRIKPKEIVAEFEYTLYQELDLVQEASNGALLRRNFTNSPLLYIPQVYWEFVSEQVMVVERIDAIPVTDISALHAHGINIKKLAENGLEIFFTQVFRDSFFHADMHPGNIFVSKHHQNNPQYLCVDFGIMGTLTDQDKRYLAENLLAFLSRDYRKVAQIHIECGWVHPDTRENEFESAIRRVCEPIFDKPLKDISFAALVLQLIQVARKFHMEVQPQLVLLQKTLLCVEGLGRQLYPDLDLWVTMKPFLEKWVRAQLSPKMFLKQMKENLPFWVDQFPKLPRLSYDVLSLMKTQKMQLTQIQAQKSKKKVLTRQSLMGFIVGMLCSGMVAFLYRL